MMSISSFDPISHGGEQNLLNDFLFWNRDHSFSPFGMVSYDFVTLDMVYKLDKIAILQIDGLFWKLV